MRACHLWRLQRVPSPGHADRRLLGRTGKVRRNGERGGRLSGPQELGKVSETAHVVTVEQASSPFKIPTHHVKGGLLREGTDLKVPTPEVVERVGRHGASSRRSVAAVSLIEYRVLLEEQVQRVLPEFVENAQAERAAAVPVSIVVTPQVSSGPTRTLELHGVPDARHIRLAGSPSEGHLLGGLTVIDPPKVVRHSQQAGLSQRSNRVVPMLVNNGHPTVSQRRDKR